MTINAVKLGRAVTFIKNLVSVVSLIFLMKTLSWNKITFSASNLLNIAELVLNEPMKSIFNKTYKYSFLCKYFKSLQLKNWITLQKSSSAWSLINHELPVF